jgi:hypothetical protein
MRAFIPGSNSTSSHDAIADFLHKECGFVVIIINGQRKEILVPDKDPIDLKCYLTVQENEIPQEFNMQLAKLYKENNWSRFPLAITGYMCVQRGVTFQCGSQEGVHDGFLFDYGIIPPNIKCAAEAYQTMARLFGNIGKIPEYKPVEIFTTERSFTRVEKQEETARNIARIVAEQGLDFVTKKELKAASTRDGEVNDDREDRDFREFTSQDDAIEFAKNIGYNKLRKRNNNEAPKELQINGVNPSSAELVNRMWGLSREMWLRMCATRNNTWCVYWKPSLVPSAPLIPRPPSVLETEIVFD